jgi:hypothetical protein
MKMRSVVLPAGLDEHPDDDPEEPRELRHSFTLHRPHYVVGLTSSRLNSLVQYANDGWSVARQGAWFNLLGRPMAIGTWPGICDRT